MNLSSEAIIKAVEDFVQLNNLQPIKFDKKRIKVLDDICSSRNTLMQFLICFDKQIQSRLPNGEESLFDVGARSGCRNMTDVKIETQLVWGQEPILIDESVRHLCVSAERVRIEVDFKKFYWRYNEPC